MVLRLPVSPRVQLGTLGCSIKRMEEKVTRTRALLKDFQDALDRDIHARKLMLEQLQAQTEALENSITLISHEFSRHEKNLREGSGWREEASDHTRESWETWEPYSQEQPYTYHRERDRWSSPLNYPQGITPPEIRAQRNNSVEPWTAPSQTACEGGARVSGS